LTTPWPEALLRQASQDLLTVPAEGGVADEGDVTWTGGARLSEDVEGSIAAGAEVLDTGFPVPLVKRRSLQKKDSVTSNKWTWALAGTSPVTLTLVWTWAGVAASLNAGEAERTCMEVEEEWMDLAAEDVVGASIRLPTWTQTGVSVGRPSVTTCQTPAASRDC
jgi:hypothetical protein